MHIWCAPTWRFHTELCKFLRNISTNICGLGKRTDLKLGEVSCLFISNKITISWLYPLDSFRLIFFIAWQWKRSIQRTHPSHNINMINILYKQKLKSRRIKIFSKGTWNFKLTRRDSMTLVIVLRFLLVKKIEVIKSLHALYRDNCPLTLWTFEFVVICKQISSP